VTPPLGARGPAYGGEYYTPTLERKTLKVADMLVDFFKAVGVYRAPQWEEGRDGREIEKG
jgi:hypothetical protein